MYNKKLKQVGARPERTEKNGQKKMKTLTKEDATKVISWYDKVGKNNWGLWSDYPLSGCSYTSFDTCHCRILFDNPFELDGETYNCISDSRNVPGKKIMAITISAVRDYIRTDAEKLANKIEGWKSDYERAIREEYANREYLRLSKTDKSILTNLLSQKKEIEGTPGSRKLRIELDSKISQYPQYSELPEWMKLAASFDTVEDYIDFKIK